MIDVTSPVIPSAWEAVYNDDTFLRQFTPSGESRFGEIKLDELKEFRLFHDGKIISLFIKTGTFGLNGFLYDTDLSCQEHDYRLIYFNRRRKTLGLINNSKDTYHIGFQVNIKGINHKRIISICNNQIQLVT